MTGVQTCALPISKFAPAAIIFTFVPYIITTISTTTTVNAVLKICSNVCDFAVADILSLPLKYPLITDAILTKNIAGDSATSVSSVSGICNIAFAIYPAPKNNNSVPY